MKRSPANHPTRRFDPIGQPFRVLNIDPSATAAQVTAAHALAIQRREDSQEALIDARNAILDVDLRLSCELAYPIDSAAHQIETFYAALSSDKPTSELLQIAHHLGPLSQANFLACLGSRRPVESPELIALIEAQAAVDANEVYDILRAVRRRAGLATPSLVSVSQELQGLFIVQGEAALSGYDTAQQAAEALSGCATTILADGERYRIEALSDLLSAYRRSTTAERSKADADIRNASENLQRHPDGSSAIEKLTGELAAWGQLCRPLIAFNAYGGHHDQDIEDAVDHLRVLLADLSARRHLETFRIVVELARALFGSAPDRVGAMDKTALLFQKLSCEAEIAALDELIEQAPGDSSLVKILERDGFGNKSGQAALGLWQTFCRAVDTTKASDYADQPWILIRDLAAKLSESPDNLAAASSVLSGAIQHAEDEAADPEIQETFRADLRDIQARRPGIASGKRPAWGRFGKHALLAGAALFGSVGMFMLYRHFEPVVLRELSPSPNQLAAQTSTSPDAEVIPPVGRGQRLALSSVRYCRFQEERLRIVKRHVNGSDDVRAYNMLASDYNSRCSDFFYQDKDQKDISDEMDIKRPMLEADAMRILATWPWHAANKNIPPSN
jgi:hypothetical protein